MVDTIIKTYTCVRATMLNRNAKEYVLLKDYWRVVKEFQKEIRKYDKRRRK